MSEPRVLKATLREFQPKQSLAVYSVEGIEDYRCEPPATCALVPDGRWSGEDKARMDWLETKSVAIREPATTPFGSGGFAARQVLFDRDEYMHSQVVSLRNNVDSLMWLELGAKNDPSYRATRYLALLERAVASTKAIPDDLTAEIEREIEQARAARAKQLVAMEIVLLKQRNEA